VKRNPLNDEQNTLFDQRMRYWQGQLSLNDWRVERGKKRTTAMAAVHIDYAARLASYNTGNFGATDITPETIDETALHEMLHVLLAGLLHTISKTNDGDLQESAEHGVISTLEKLLKGRI
jgi:hypothetical protein